MHNHVSLFPNSNHLPSVRTAYSPVDHSWAPFLGLGLSQPSRGPIPKEILHSLDVLDGSGGVAGFRGFVPMSGLLGYGHPNQLRVLRNGVRFRRRLTASRARSLRRQRFAYWDSRPSFSTSKRWKITIT
jgi:hypothetical protein